MPPTILNCKQPITKPPKELIYMRRIYNVMKPPQKEYVLFDTQTGKLKGLMCCHKSKYRLREDYDGPTLCLDFIETYDREKGYGKSLINFAKNLSKQIGCNGFVCLKAVSDFTPERIPHLFYRKQGFTTLNKQIDKKMDKFIKHKRPALWQDFDSEIMYYPDTSSQKSKFRTIVENIMKRVKI